MAKTIEELERDPRVGNRLAAGDGDMSFIEDDGTETRIGEVPDIVREYMEEHRANIKKKQTEDAGCSCQDEVIKFKGSKDDERLKFTGLTIDTKKGKIHIHVHKK